MAKIYSLRAGTLLPDEILKIAERERIRTARVEAIGGVKKLRIAFFNHESKKYEEHDYEEFLEVTGLLGNVTLKGGRPFLHMHGTFGRRDTTVVGGHLVSATVFPLLELVITRAENTARKKFDKKLGLNVIYNIE